MDDKQEIVRKKSFDVNKHLIDKVWEDREKGLRKEVINFRYLTIVRASELSKCLVDILDIQNLDKSKYKTNYVIEENIGNELWINIGDAVTPIDCYVEEFLKNMLTNETSKCFIETKSSGTIAFTMRLKRIEFGGYYFEQKASTMYELAKHYKDNGVKMFKDYPLFAHNYFNIAAKCLLSFHAFDDIEDVLKDCELKIKDFEELLQNIYSNISACLIKENRYDEIISILEYTKKQEKPSEKAIFRLATAYLHTNNYDEALKTIIRVDYKGNKELMHLMNTIQQNRKEGKDKDSQMAKKMLFG